MSDTPTLELTSGAVLPEAAQAPAEPKLPDNIVIDAKGRTLKLGELDVLAESRLIRLVGAEAAINQAYMQCYVFPAVAVVEINGEPMPLPQTQREIDAAISRLGHEGVNAVIDHWAKQRKKLDEEAKRKVDEDAKAALKN